MRKLFGCVKFQICISLCLSTVFFIADTYGQAQSRTQEILYERAAVTEVWGPVPGQVLPGASGSPPSDAIVLFDGKNFDAWESADGGEVNWKLVNGTMVVAPGAGAIRTRESFGNVQLHIEWRTPVQVEGDGQARGNSGIYLMERYEVQVLDSFNNPTYVNGQAGSIYKQHAPLVNASLGPGEWQEYDIIFMAPLFGTDGSVTRPATMTVLQNGVLIQNHVTLSGSTEYIGLPAYKAHGEAPVRLQDHQSPVEFRNIWIRRL